MLLEGELFAGHSFSNINEAIVRRLGEHPGIALHFGRKISPEVRRPMDAAWMNDL